MRILLAAMLLSTITRAGSAQSLIDSLSTAGRGTLVVRTTPDSGWVYVDSLFVGRAPVRVEMLRPGMHTVRVVHPDFANWLTETIRDSVPTAAGGEVLRTYTLGQWYSIVSVPSDAQVFSGDSIIGTTPLVLSPLSIPTDSTLTLRKKGYAPVSTSLALASRGVLLIPLSPSGEPSGENDWRLSSSVAARTSTLPLWISGGSAVLFGGFSAYYKLEADRHQSSYISTGNPYHLVERDRLDGLSALYFVAAQVGLGVFIWYLLSD